jgi:hypothetical protein
VRPFVYLGGGGAGSTECEAGTVVSGAREETRFVPPTYAEGDRVVMPVFFPDGSTAELTYPASLDLASLGLQVAQIWVRLTDSAGSDRDVWITYGPVDGTNVSGDEPIECVTRGSTDRWRSGGQDPTGDPRSRN